jgi:hypothetical protein
LHEQGRFEHIRKPKRNHGVGRGTDRHGFKSIAVPFDQGVAAGNIDEGREAAGGEREERRTGGRIDGGQAAPLSIERLQRGGGFQEAERSRERLGKDVPSQG